MRVVRPSTVLSFLACAVWPAGAAGAPAPGAPVAPAAAVPVGPTPTKTPTRTPTPVKAATNVVLPAPPSGAGAGGSPAQGSGVSAPKPPGPPPFTLAALYYFEPGTGTKYAGARQGNSWLLPRIDTMSAAGVSFLFDSNVPKGEIAEVIEKRVCCSELLVAGRSAQVTALAYSGEQIFVRAVVPDMGSWPKTVQLHLYHQGIMASPPEANRLSSLGGGASPSGAGQTQAPVSSVKGSSTAPILRPFMDYKSTPATVQAKKVSYFASFLFSTFTSSRCSDCHSMGDSNAVRSQHEANGVSGIDASKPHVATCGGTSCHTLVNDWRTPPFSMGINWKGKSAKEICGIVTNHLPTAQGLHGHFHDDPRVVWAVSSGWVPRRNPLPTAPPHNLQAWLQTVDAWINGGFPCPD